MGPDAHPTGVLAAIELEAPFSGANDVWVIPAHGVTGDITIQGANSGQGALVIPTETTTVVSGTSVVEVVDNTPKPGKAITYGATVSTVTTVLTRSQARKRTPHELLPAMTIPKVSRTVPVAVLETVKESRKIGSSPKEGRKDHIGGLLQSVDPEWMSTVARAQAADPFFGPLLRLGEQDREMLTLQERSRMKQFSVLEGLLFYTPQQGGNPVTRLCVPVSDNSVCGKCHTLRF